MNIEKGKSEYERGLLGNAVGHESFFNDCVGEIT